MTNIGVFFHAYTTELSRMWRCVISHHYRKLFSQLAECARARGLHSWFHELGVGRSPEILLDQIAGATLRQPRG